MFSYDKCTKIEICYFTMHLTEFTIPESVHDLHSSAISVRVTQLTTLSSSTDCSFKETFTIIY